MGKISALAVWQPWAWLIVSGHKDIENRYWEPTADRIGKRFAVYAPKRRIKKDEFERFLTEVRKQKISKYPKSIDDFEYGMIVGSVVLEKVSRKSKSPWAQPGLVHWKVKSAKKSPKKRIKRGFQSWFTVKL